MDKCWSWDALDKINLYFLCMRVGSYADRKPKEEFRLPTPFILGKDTKDLLLFTCIKLWSSTLRLESGDGKLSMAWDALLYLKIFLSSSSSTPLYYSISRFAASGANYKFISVFFTGEISSLLYLLFRLNFSINSGFVCNYPLDIA